MTLTVIVQIAQLIGIGVLTLTLIVYYQILKQMRVDTRNQNTFNLIQLLERPDIIKGASEPGSGSLNREKDTALSVYEIAEMMVEEKLVHKELILTNRREQYINTMLEMAKERNLPNEIKYLSNLLALKKSPSEK